MELSEGINFADFIKGPVTFKIDLGSQTEISDLANLEDCVDGDNEVQTLSAPWTESFEKLRHSMTAVPDTSGKIFRRITKNGIGEPMGRKRCRIQWSFSMFYENELTSFDSSYLESTSIKTQNNDDMLLGIALALTTMCKQEEAEFVIDYRLMFGEKGIIIDENNYHRRPRADILLCVKLYDFAELSNDAAADNPDEMRVQNFKSAKNMVNIEKRSQSEAVSSKRYTVAIKIGFKAIERLQFCTIENDSEQTERNALLVHFYTVIADCHNHCENWKRALLICKELQSLTNVMANVQLLVIYATASSHVNDDYKEAIELLRTAQKIEPHNMLVNNKLREYIKASRNQQWGQNDFCRRAFGNIAANQPKVIPAKLETEIGTLINSVERMGIDESIPLIGYTARQLTVIEQALEDKRHILLQKLSGPDGEIRYSIKKSAN